ncbi:MAG: hypothetical protein HY721_18945, partial [Planctomycetes bacterium]|nr:hypothetical protein [Planctomycetota bacterium]
MLTTIRFRCYYCHRVHEVGSAAAGKRGRCACGKLMMVPPGAPEGAGAGDGSLPFARPSEGQGGGP